MCKSCHAIVPDDIYFVVHLVLCREFSISGYPHVRIIKRSFAKVFFKYIFSVQKHSIQKIQNFNLKSLKLHIIGSVN